MLKGDVDALRELYRQQDSIVKSSLLESAFRSGEHDFFLPFAHRLECRYAAIDSK